MIWERRYWLVLWFLPPGEGPKGYHRPGVLLRQRLPRLREVVARIYVIVRDRGRGRKVRGDGYGRRICRFGRVTGRKEVIHAIEGVEKGEGGRRRYNPFSCGVLEVLEDDVDSDVGPLPAEAMDEVGRHAGDVSRDVVVFVYIFCTGKSCQESPA